MAGADSLPAPAGSLLGAPLPTKGVALWVPQPCGLPPSQACRAPGLVTCARLSVFTHSTRGKPQLLGSQHFLAGLLRCHSHAAQFTHVSIRVRGFYCCMGMELWPSPLSNSRTLRHPEMKPYPYELSPPQSPPQAPSRPWRSQFWTFHTWTHTLCGLPCLVPSLSVKCSGSIRGVASVGASLLCAMDSASAPPSVGLWAVPPHAPQTARPFLDEGSERSAQSPGGNLGASENAGCRASRKCHPPESP